MKSNNVDVFIYVQSADNPDVVNSTVTKIAELSGVIKANINPKIKQILAVEYDPNHISGGAILNVVRNNGCTASLVGL